MRAERNNNFCKENTKPEEQGSQHHQMTQEFYYPLNDFFATSLRKNAKTN